ncbi:MAG TPA: hypothetical protein VJM32_04655 [Candidatus Saccharimonadales bacterium]|nr:hypothetical protein [Candidatus Saccharimonadales bacterium]
MPVYTELYTPTLGQEQIDHSVRGNVMSGTEMQAASGRVQEFLDSDAAEGLFSESERVYAEIALGLVHERGETLDQSGGRGPMGPAFMDAYRHIRGMMRDERAQDPHSADLTALSNAHAAGEVASEKLDALLAAAHGKRDLGTAVEYITSEAFQAEHPTVEHGPDMFRGMSQGQIDQLAAAAMASLLGK